MLRFLADENLNNNLVRALRMREPASQDGEWEGQVVYVPLR